MDINYYAVVACGVVAMIIGGVWYGPIFGKKWMEITEADCEDLEKKKEMQKGAGPLYLVQFVLALFQAFVLSYYIHAMPASSGIDHAVWIWVAFIMPTIAASAMWTADSSKMKWARFLLQAGCQLVTFVVFGFILGMWR